MNEVEIRLLYEEAAILLELLEDKIAEASDEKRPKLIDMHSKVLSGALKADIEEKTDG